MRTRSGSKSASPKKLRSPMKAVKHSPRKKVATPKKNPSTPSKASASSSASVSQVPKVEGKLLNFAEFDMSLDKSWAEIVEEETTPKNMRRPRKATSPKRVESGDKFVRSLELKRGELSSARKSERLRSHPRPSKTIKSEHPDTLPDRSQPSSSHKRKRLFSGSSTVSIEDENCLSDTGDAVEGPSRSRFPPRKTVKSVVQKAESASKQKAAESMVTSFKRSEVTTEWSFASVVKHNADELTQRSTVVKSEVKTEWNFARSEPRSARYGSERGETVLSSTPNSHHTSRRNRSSASSVCSSPSRFNPKDEWVEPKLGWCRDEAILDRRSKEIAKAKEKPVYARYLSEVPRADREKHHPRTPNKYLNFSRRSWDAQIRNWKRNLYLWGGEEPSASCNTSVCGSFSDSEKGSVADLTEFDENMDTVEKEIKVEIPEPDSMASLLGHFDLDTRTLTSTMKDESTLNATTGIVVGPKDFSHIAQ